MSNIFDPFAGFHDDRLPGSRRLAVLMEQSIHQAPTPLTALEFEEGSFELESQPEHAAPLVPLSAGMLCWRQSKNSPERGVALVKINRVIDRGEHTKVEYTWEEDVQAYRAKKGKRGWDTTEHVAFTPADIKTALDKKLDEALKAPDVFVPRAPEFRIGDCVKIAKNMRGTDPWVSSMCDTVGLEGVVMGLDGRAVRVHVKHPDGSSYYYYPPEALHHVFKPGDKVRVVRRITRVEDPKFQDSWCMDGFIGEIGVVSRLVPEKGKIGVICDVVELNYSPFSLEPARG